MKALVFFDSVKQINSTSFVQRKRKYYASTDQIATKGETHRANCFHASLLRDKCCAPDNGCNAQKAICYKTGHNGDSPDYRIKTTLVFARNFCPAKLPRLTHLGCLKARGMRFITRRMRWRPGPELNRCTRFCKPLHNHSATGPPSKPRNSLIRRC